MGFKTSSTPLIKVNNKEQKIVAGSLKYDIGDVAVKVTAYSIGGGKTETGHAEDASTGIGKVSFELPLNKEVNAVIADWKSKINGCVIQLLEKMGTEVQTIVFQGHSIVNNPEREVSPEGKVTIEFEGDPAEVF